MLQGCLWCSPWPSTHNEYIGLHNPIWDLRHWRRLDAQMLRLVCQLLILLMMSAARSTCCKTSARLSKLVISATIAGTSPSNSSCSSANRGLLHFDGCFQILSPPLCYAFYTYIITCKPYFYKVYQNVTKFQERLMDS